MTNKELADQLVRQADDRPQLHSAPGHPAHVPCAWCCPWCWRSVKILIMPPRAADADQLLERGQQRCCTCRQVRELTEFSPEPKRRSGRHARCRECSNAQVRQRRRELRSRRPAAAQIRADMIAALRKPQPAELPSCCTGTWSPAGWQHDPACFGRLIPVDPQRVLAARNGLGLCRPGAAAASRKAGYRGPRSPPQRLPTISRCWTGWPAASCGARAAPVTGCWTSSRKHRHHAGTGHCAGSARTRTSGPAPGAAGRSPGGAWCARNV